MFEPEDFFIKTMDTLRHQYIFRHFSNGISILLKT